MTEVFAPHLARNVRVDGCKLPRHAPRGLRLGAYIDRAKTEVQPTTVDYMQKALAVLRDIEGNDTLGDCVFAEAAHYIACVTANANTIFAYSREQTIADYSAVTGYNPSDPSTDQGADPTVELDYRVSHGYADGSKDIGWALVDGGEWTEVEFAINECGNLKMWLGLPDSYINPFPSADGFLWTKDTANENNGHCIGSSAYGSPLIVGADGSKGLQVYTWGLVGTMTPDAVAALCVPRAGGGLAVRITPDWVSKQTQKTASGLALADLISDCNAAFGSRIPIPAPAPPPPPPAPGGPVTLAAVDALLDHYRSGFALVERAPLVDAIKAALPSLGLWPS